ncbi:MAG: hypothetical protein K2P99_05850 [Burkholderiales bacterium]|nr:hypothetical protein [Burkholderiales bacterium]
MATLTFSDHSRIFAEYTYVYPVLSRRSQGISLGINLSVNNACNWRCVYCQVDGLIRGKPYAISLTRLEYELDELLNVILNGNFLQHYAPNGMRRLNDICLSGNGEATLSDQFRQVVEIIIKLRNKYGIKDDIKSLLITNGSEVERQDIKDSLSLLNANNGEVWFKIDRAGVQDISLVNQVNLSTNNIRKRLLICSGLCKTLIQSCFFKTNGINPTDTEIVQYVDLIAEFKGQIAGVLIYSTARNPMLPEGGVISQVSHEFLSAIADKLEQRGVGEVKYYV